MHEVLASISVIVYGTVVWQCCSIVAARSRIRAGYRAMTMDRRPVRRNVLPAVPSELTAYELAYLTVGPSRAADAALAAVVTAGAARVSRKGTLSPVAGAAPLADPLECAVLAALTGYPRGRPAAEVRKWLAASPAISGLSRRLVERGLKLPSGDWRDLRKLLAVSVSLIAIPVLGLIVVAILHLVGPVPVPEALLVVAGAAVGMAVGAWGLRMYAAENRWWDRGHATLRRLLAAAKAAYLRLSPMEQAGQVSMGVAIYGLVQMPDREAAAGLEEQPDTRPGAVAHDSSGNSHGGSGGDGDADGGGCGDGGCGGGCGCGG